MPYHAESAVKQRYAAAAETPEAALCCPSAVCDKTYQLYRQPPYGEFFEFVEPLESVPLENAKPFDCSGMRLRHPQSGLCLHGIIWTRPRDPSEHLKRL